VTARRILFLHHNFPAQFGHLAAHLAQRGNDVVFLSEQVSGDSIPGVRLLRLKGSWPKEQANLDGQIACGQRFGQGLRRLQAEGWTPEIVISHSGWGCGLEAGLVFPKARRIAYLEWWFADQAANNQFDPKNPWLRYPESFQNKLRLRNFSLAYELAEANVIVSPTQWQRNQLPSSLRERVEVIHEGVDTDYFMNNPIWKPKLKLRITYATRGMEPMRGFPEMIQAMAKVLPMYPHAELVIAGENRICYGGSPPPQGSFQAWAEQQLAHCRDQVTFTGRLPRKHYARLLQSSHLHLYFTRPFVASWSLVEAMACGCCVLASRTPPVQEIADASATLWTDHTDAKALAEGISSAITLEAEDRDAKGQQQRARAEQQFNRKTSTSHWEALL